MSEKKFESGQVENQTKTTYTGKDKDGKVIREEVVKNKETGEVTRTVNGKPVENTKPVDGKQDFELNALGENKKPALLEYRQSNGEFITIKLLEMIVNQLKELNYRLAKVEEKKEESQDEE